MLGGQLLSDTKFCALYKPYTWSSLDRNSRENNYEIFQNN